MAQCVSHSNGELNFYLKNSFLLIKKNWLGVATYFCFIFKRVNKIRKKNPKCDSLLWKRWYVKNRIGFGGQVTYWEGTVKTIAPSKSLKSGSLLIEWRWRDNQWESQWILTLNMHDVGSRACIKNEQNMSGCVPGPPVTNALSWNMINKWRIDKIMRMSRNRINQTSMVNKSINQSISQS